MSSNAGWSETLVLFILELVPIGPGRLPKVIEGIHVLLLAARTATNGARDNLSDEFGEDFDGLRKSLQELNDLRRLNPKTIIIRTLFDGDNTYLDMPPNKPAADSGETGAIGVAGVAGVAGTAGQQYQQPNTNQSVQLAPPQRPVPQSVRQPTQQLGTWQDSAAQARQQQAQQTPQQPQQPQQPRQPRGVQTWIDDGSLQRSQNVSDREW